MRQVIAEALRKDGYEVIEAVNGQEVLALLAPQLVHDTEAGVIDLLVSDIRMPTCNGSQILEQLRSARRQTPVILMTAFGDAAIRERTEQLGGILFDKPFDIHDLRTAVACLLRAHGDAPESPTGP